MIIRCPYCGERYLSEFSYLGDHRLADRPDVSQSDEDWHDYVYLRDNPAGRHKEIWRHAGGCGAWLYVTRDTITHQIILTEPAGGLKDG